MRGDGVGVGDVGAVHDRGGSSGQPCRCVDRRRASRDNEHGVICGRRGHEHSRAEQRRKHGIGVGDGAWIWAGTGRTDGDGTGRGDGMRGDGVGVGDLSAMPGRSGRAGHIYGCGDGRTWRGKCYGSVLHRHEEADGNGGGIQHGSYRIGGGNGAWIRAGDSCLDGDGTGRGDGMRGDGVGVGDIGAVQDGAWRERKRRDDGDGGGEGRELDGGMVGGRS